MLEKLIYLKCALLIEGCQIEKGIRFPKNVHQKAIHLYAHSNEHFGESIPDDIILGENDAKVICRIRYNSTSSKKIVVRDERYYLLDEKEGSIYPISFQEDVSFRGRSIEKYSLESICSLLGQDLLGVVPSNYCFYFSNNRQCRFCEIFQTYNNEVDFDRTLKKVPLIVNAVVEALQYEPRMHHLALTTGNITSYDYTFNYFIDIGNKLKEHPSMAKIDHVLATLMPPENFSLIEALSRTKFNKIYFPIEVFEYEHFKRVCPGKDEYGYEKILFALEHATQHFGVGNTYTNLVYGIQSLDQDLRPQSYDPEIEYEKSLLAVEEMLQRNVIPAFTLYHFGGYNQIGKISLDIDTTFRFFLEWGRRVFESGIVAENKEAVLFGPHSLSNTLFNDAFRLSKMKTLERPCF